MLDGRRKWCGHCQQYKPFSAFFAGRSTMCLECRAKVTSRAVGPVLEEHFTAEQLATAEMMCQGKTNAEIAEVLHKAPGTVKRYVGEVMHKMDADNRTLAAVRYMERKLKDAI